MTADPHYPGILSDTKRFHLFGLFTAKALFIQGGVVNGAFLAYYVLYALRDRMQDPLMLILFHVCVLSIVFVIPGFVTATLASRSYWDIVHFAAFISMLSSASVLGVKLLLNALHIPISALTFSIAILAYSNFGLVCQSMIRAKCEKERASAVCAKGSAVGSGENAASRHAGLLAIVILGVLFVFMELLSFRLGPIPDTDQASFGTYTIMTRSVPGAGYYEEARTKVYPNYTPFLKYDFSHPPLVPFSNAYVATLCGYLEHSKTVDEQWTANRYRPSTDYSGLKVDRGYLACNRASSHYHIVLLGLLVYIFALRLTGRPVLALITMLCPIGMFWHIYAYKFFWLSIYKSVFVLYSLLMLYSFLYCKQDHKFAFMLALCGSLINQKVVFVLPPILAVDIFTSRWRTARNPYAIGFASGVLAFIVYGMLIDARVFISHYFVVHFSDRITTHAYTWGAMGVQWQAFVGEIIGFWSFLVLGCLSIVFAARRYRSRTIVLFLYWLSSAFCGTWIWPYMARFLTPIVFPMVLMGCASVGDLLGKFTKHVEEKGEDGGTPADGSGFGTSHS